MRDFLNYIKSGNSKFDLGDRKGALEDYTKAIELKPEIFKDSEAYQSQWLVYRLKTIKQELSIRRNKNYIEIENPHLKHEKCEDNLLPAGEYWISDPQYFEPPLDSETFDHVWENSHIGGVFQISNGDKYAVFSTWQGDGFYKDNRGRTYGVDSGSLSCFPSHYLAQNAWYRSRDDMGRIIKMNSPFTCESYDENKLIRFGDIEINTAII